MPEDSPPASPGPIPPRRQNGVSGRGVVIALLTFGLTVVLGVGLFAAMTRPPRHAATASPGGSSAATAPSSARASGW